MTPGGKIKNYNYLLCLNFLFTILLASIYEIVSCSKHLLIYELASKYAIIKQARKRSQNANIYYIAGPSWLKDSQTFGW